MRKYKKHIVADMDNSMIQRCIICGEIISDYTNAMWPSGQSPPKGFGAGEVYISKGFPTISTIQEPEEGFENCK